MMQCKDIDTRAVLRFLAAHDGEWCTWGKGYGMPTVQDAMPEGTPEKLQRTKMAGLIRRGLVDGCPCGCRGDYEITNAGLAFISDRPPRPADAIYCWCALGRAARWLDNHPEARKCMPTIPCGHCDNTGYLKREVRDASQVAHPTPVKNVGQGRLQASDMNSQISEQKKT